MRVITLCINPETPADAMMAVNAITSGKASDDIIEQRMSVARAAEGDWLEVQFLSPRLVFFFNKLREGKLFPATCLSMFGDMLSGRAVRGVFNRTTHASSHGMTALWNNQTNIITSMTAMPDTYVDRRQGKEKQAESVWVKRAKLMLPSRLRLPLTRAPAVLLPRPSMASAWYPFTFRIKLTAKQKNDREKALCLYLNSSAGILALMGVKGFKTLCYPAFSVDSMERLSVPDFSALSHKQITALAKAFDRNAAKEFLPLRDMALCDVRREVDTEIANILKIPQEHMDELREELPREPSISGRRYTGLTLS